jgi:hypothetical protein
VGNVGTDVTEEQLRDMFAVHGTIASVTLVNDRDTAQPRGFALVEMGRPYRGQAGHFFAERHNPERAVAESQRGASESKRRSNATFV